ncbi:MAG: hypothetical protein ACR2MP_18385, partial [Streptosporangiaceae bacterium]
GPAWIEAAAGLAARSAAACTTWSYHQPPAAWLARLRPITASPLYPALAQAAWTPGILAWRDHDRQAAAGTVTGERIRDLTPGSVDHHGAGPPGHHHRQRAQRDGRCSGCHRGPGWRQPGRLGRRARRRREHRGRRR